MLFHAKNNTAKWKGRNLFSYSVSAMSQIVSTKRVLALVRVKLWPPVFPQKSIATEIILTAKKVYLKPRYNVRMLIQQKGNICILAFTKSNNNNCYNLTGWARTVSPIKHTGFVPVRLGIKKCDQQMSGTGNTELKGIETEKLGIYPWYNEIIFINIPKARHSIYEKLLPVFSTEGTRFEEK